jgi:polysaccharide biosynthesis transport protein
MSQREDRNLPAIASPVVVNYQAPEGDREEPMVPLSHYLWVFKRHRWNILAFVVTCVIASVIVSLRMTPVFEATATIDVDRQAPAAIVGPEAAAANQNYNDDQFFATQLKIMQSDSVLRPVVEKFGLRRAPAATRAPGAASDDDDAPVSIGGLRVTRPANTSLMLVTYRSPDRRRAAEIANAVAQAYVEHTYRIRYRSTVNLSEFMQKQLEELKAKMEASSGRLTAYQMHVANPEEKGNIVSSRLMQLNTEYTGAQGERVRKEVAYNSVKNGSSPAAQVSNVHGEALSRLDQRLSELEQKFTEVKSHYGSNHPEYKKVSSQIAEVQRLRQEAVGDVAQRAEVEYRDAVNREAMLQRAVAETKAEYDKLNSRSYEYQNLKREADDDKRLYEELVRKIKEAGINANFQNSSVRIADAARPPLGPISPDVRRNAFLAFVFSALFALVAAVVGDRLDNTIRNPEQAARALKTHFIGSLPMVRSWKSRLELSSSGKSNKALMPRTDGEPVLANYEEAIRALRTSILLSDQSRRLRSILVTSASPGEGKSTIATHMAVAHAQQRHRTLLIDCDLRRPSVYHLLGIDGTMGLSTVLLEDTAWQSALITLENIPELDILPAGLASRRAADLVGKGLARILEESSLVYDLVILDSPPMLGFAEPLQMSTMVDGVVVVARAGHTSRIAVNSAVTTLNRLGARTVGLVLNEVTRDMGENYGYYGYRYSRYYSKRA